jgi:hypothetical protein
LKQAVAGLAEAGTVICVRLALFAEMMKTKAWTPGTLKEVGGTAGVGIKFLEETFSSPTANPKHRLHQKAARGVLKALLPATGTDIKGYRRSANELLKASGYATRRAEFAELMRILDAELRLVTPADAEEARSAERGVRSAEEHPSHDEVTAPSAPHSALCAPRSYQLTHDYLVPSLRDWLTQTQRETRRGRAELCLAERAAAYATKLNTRFLPNCWEWANIQSFTQHKKWTAPERRVMRAARWYHGVRLARAVVLIAIAGFTALEAYRRVELRRASDLPRRNWRAPKRWRRTFFRRGPKACRMRSTTSGRWGAWPFRFCAHDSTMPRATRCGGCTPPTRWPITARRLGNS